MKRSKTQTEINEKGFSIVNSFFDPARIEKLEVALKSAGAFNFSDIGSNSMALLRHCDAVLSVACDPVLLAILRECSCPDIHPVNAVILDKSSGSNWEIPWHQDLTIAVREKREVEGYVNWNVLAGINHVQPPARILEKMITVRIHFDHCSESNGAISVIPGSQQHGICTERTISADTGGSAVLCEVDKYGVMFMKPLLLHNSPTSKSSSRRRILHIEYGPVLDGGLLWHSGM